MGEQDEVILKVRRAIKLAGVDLSLYGTQVTRVSTLPRPIGFDFTCLHPEMLRKKAREVAATTGTLAEDNTNTLEGKVVASQSKGNSFREVGVGTRALHLTIALNGYGNVHIDSVGFVAARGVYNYCQALPHLYWDLAGDVLGWKAGIFKIGDGRGGLRIAAMAGKDSLDGVDRINIGIGGTF